ncbi:hypothetical protein ACTFIU_002666 [Dictyostelium citrinum]
MKKIFIFVFIYFYSFFGSFASPLILDPTEAQLLNDLISFMNVNMTGFPTISEGVYDYCNSSDQYRFVCSSISNKVFLIYADIEQTNTLIIKSSNFSFSNLNVLKLKNCHLSPDFLTTINIDSIVLDGCNVIRIESPIMQSYLEINNPPSFQGEFKFSYLNKFGQFKITPNIDIGQVSVTYVNDLKSVLYINALSLVSNYIPSFTNVNVIELNLYLSDNYSYSDTSNITTMTNVQKFSLINNSTIDFPISIFYIQNSIMTSLSIAGMLNKPNKMIELPQNNNITELIFGYVFREFQINGTIPFPSLPPNINSFQLSGGNYPNETDLSKFSNVYMLEISDSNLNFKLPKKNNFENLDLSYNMIKGTVDSSFCTMNSLTLNLRSNDLSGTLPSCFSCYPLSSSSIFALNNNLKYSTTCTTIKANIYNDKTNKRLIMWGTDIGLNSIDFYTDPYFPWEPVIPSYRFEAFYFSNVLLPSNGIFTVYFQSISLKPIIIKVNSTQSQLPPPCYRECTIGEYCDTNTLRCVCAVGWSGDDCSINTNIYVSSIDSVDEKGGDITLYGWFTNSHNNLSITIDNKDCPIIENTITNVSIQCTVSAGTGKKSLSIQQNGGSWSGYFIYETSIKSCLNNCSKNGECNINTGECNCRLGYTGFDCSIISGGGNSGLPSSNTTINNNGTTVINNQKTSYQILITKLIEFDVEKNIIQQYTLDNKWTIEIKNTNDDDDNNNIYQFSQTLVQSLSNCTISYTVEEIKGKSKDFSFAGYNLTLGEGSIKISVSIYNYQYSSFLNNLQLQFQSSVTSDNNDCNKEETDIQNSNNELLNYITIKKDSKIMQARFLNRILSDGRSSIITSDLVSKSSDSVIIGLNLPYCTNCIIDPDFSVLVTTSFKNGCTSESERPAYLIPVVVVSSVIGVALIVALSYYIYKKKFVENQLSKKLKKIETQHS